jgi:hypothetical protein
MLLQTRCPDGAQEHSRLVTEFSGITKRPLATEVTGSADHEFHLTVLSNCSLTFLELIDGPLGLAMAFVPFKTGFKHLSQLIRIPGLLYHADCPDFIIASRKVPESVSTVISMQTSVH